MEVSSLKGASRNHELLERHNEADYCSISNYDYLVPEENLPSQVVARTWPQAHGCYTGVL